MISLPVKIILPGIGLLSQNDNAKQTCHNVGMARVATITDEHILSAAREVFLAQGFNAATTTIATKAGISSGSIFKRFPTKEALFLAAMTCDSDWASQLATIIGQGDLKVNLEGVAKSVLGFARDLLPSSMLAWSLRETSTIEQETPFIRDLRLVAEFLEQERDLGRLRPSLDTQVAAHTLVGTMMHYAMLELMTGQQQASDDFIKAFIDTFWKGLVANPDSL
jgi:AcrR family transcriptional regulator